MSERWNSVLCLATVTLTVANRTRSLVCPQTGLIFLPFENEALFCFFFFFFVFDHGEKTQKRLASILLWPLGGRLFLSLSLFLSPPVLYSLEERAEAPSVTPYCGPLTCKGAMWSILMSINHYHDNSWQVCRASSRKTMGFKVRGTKVRCAKSSLILCLFNVSHWRFYSLFVSWKYLQGLHFYFVIKI